MTAADLAAHLASLGIDVHSIGRDLDERYCLVAASDGWHVYYSERGQKSGLRVFRDEDAACRALLRDVLADHGVQARLRTSGNSGSGV
ncbi:MULTISPECIES: hypothetical protein [Herbidospora]|uniref:hypothetical protein n=1 Tax=Herbidospora TaxID=28443 RepID=UPI001929A561|nr:MULTISPECIES: hypothetical protein [Herbidospora]GLX93063.1 hypothetical protein Hesp01_10130 [Herbidospora sp. NBRC 101105]